VSDEWERGRRQWEREIRSGRGRRKWEEGEKRREGMEGERRRGRAQKGQTTERVSKSG
jgi:hypothetical protein